MMSELEMQAAAHDLANRWNSIHGDDWKTIHDEIMKLLKRTPSREGMEEAIRAAFHLGNGYDQGCELDFDEMEHLLAKAER